VLHLVSYLLKNQVVESVSRWLVNHRRKLYHVSDNVALSSEFCVEFCSKYLLE